MRKTQRTVEKSEEGKKKGRINREKKEARRRGRWGEATVEVVGRRGKWIGGKLRMPPTQALARASGAIAARVFFSLCW